MKKNRHDMPASSETLLRALSEPISEVDLMSASEVRSYLAANGIDSAKLRSALTTRLQAVSERVAVSGTSGDLVTRFNKVRPNLASVVGVSKTTLNRRFTGLLSLSPQRASQLVDDLEQADETGMRELYETLRSWADE